MGVKDLEEKNDIQFFQSMGLTVQGSLASEARSFWTNPHFLGFQTSDDLT